MICSVEPPPPPGLCARSIPSSSTHLIHASLNSAAARTKYKNFQSYWLIGEQVSPNFKQLTGKENYRNMLKFFLINEHILRAPEKEQQVILQKIKK